MPQPYAIHTHARIYDARICSKKNGTSHFYEFYTLAEVKFATTTNTKNAINFIAMC